ncbi:Leu/Ile/Val/Thr-binding protein precursor [Variovorax sp. SRS16]|uniref:ABC transporter substrate-binding protein n=1 Tax=Variovorax sp. SRS16 TaxID=282217 RepID=UPI0013199BF3|nr:penicillin-binding protein activator [Variovorax sp. SRS16]VTU33704.1 Leu/Ile/Val/Thr-binding protein precursor [Variovorax sp. SRS16]
MQPRNFPSHLQSRRRVLRAAGGAAAAIAASSLAPLRAFAQADEFRIGWIRPTTGKLASSFAPLYAGGLIAIDEINAAGGIMGRKLTIVEEDDEASPAKEPAVMRKLKSAGIDYVVGPTGSAQSLSALATGTQSRMIQTCISNGEDMANGTKYPYHFLCVYTTAQEGQVAAQYMVNQLKIRKIGILSEMTPFGESAAAASQRKIKELTGVDAVSAQTYLMSATDLTTQVQALQKAGCEGVIVWMSSNVHISMAFSAMARMGWIPPILGHVNLFNDSLFDLVPEQSLRSVYGVYYRNWTYTDSAPASDKNIALAKKLQAASGVKGIEAYVAGTPHYDFLHLLKQVIEQEKSFDVDVVRKAFNATRGYKGAIGTLGFSETEHGGLSLNDITVSSVASSRDPRSKELGALRLRAPGA